MQDQNNNKKTAQAEASDEKKKASSAVKKPATSSSATKKATPAKTASAKSAPKTSAKSASSSAKKPAASKQTGAKKPAAKSAASKSAVKESVEEQVKNAEAAPVESTQTFEEIAVTPEVKEEAATQIEPVQDETAVNESEAAEELPEAKAEEVKAEEEVAATQPDETATEKKAAENSERSEEVTAEQLDAQIAAGDFSHFDDAAERAKEQAIRDAKTEADKLIPPDPDAILEVRHLKKYFVLKKTITGKPLSTLKAVDDVSFKIMPGETLGIVGESGCGKTTMGRTVLKLHQPTSGQVFFEGEDIAGYKSAQMRPLRTKMQIVFQDPYSSLPPRSTVGGILAEAVKVHKVVPNDQIKDYVLDVMDKCGLRDYYYERYPHEFSGGQRQRICIARALVLNPKLVVCDEPVSALDVSIQAQIINLLKKLQQERGLTYLFISHDLSVVKYISDKIGVMYLGSMVEFGDKDKIFNNPMHPYTVALFSAVPNPNPDEKTERIILKGDIPSPANPPMGCKFHTRCSKCMEICKHVAPVYKEYEEGHFVACHCYSQED